MIHGGRQVGIDEKVQDRKKLLLHHTNGNIYIYKLHKAHSQNGENRPWYERRCVR